MKIQLKLVAFFSYFNDTQKPDDINFFFVRFVHIYRRNTSCVTHLTVRCLFKCCTHVLGFWIGLYIGLSNRTMVVVYNHWCVEENVNNNEWLCDNLISFKLSRRDNSARLCSNIQICKNFLLQTISCIMLWR